jgi:hypothetical protein
MDDREREIDIFRKEEEEAQQSFFAYLGVRSLLAQRSDLLEVVNRNSMCWITSQHGLLTTTSRSRPVWEAYHPRCDATDASGSLIGSERHRHAWR